MNPGARPDRFSLLFVCTGNICRSPYAERRARALIAGRLGADPPVDVASAGTGALVGQPMDNDVQAELRALGIDAADFRARELEPAMVERADLVLCAGRAHRGEVVGRSPRALRYTFTLREFARLGVGSGEFAQDSVSAAAPPAADGEAPDPIGRAREVVERARRRRGTAPPDCETDDDVPDPYGQDTAVHREVAAILDAAVRSTVRGLWG